MNYPIPRSRLARFDDAKDDATKRANTNLLRKKNKKRNSFLWENKKKIESICQSLAVICCEEWEKDIECLLISVIGKKLNSEYSLPTIVCRYYRRLSWTHLKYERLEFLIAEERGLIVTFRI